MGALFPLTLDRWNGILTDINSLAANPPSGCTSPGTLPLAEAPHIWTTADITAARGKLMVICPENSFSADATGRWLWPLIEELDEAIDNGWCGCTVPCEGDVVLPFSGPSEVTYPETETWMVMCVEGGWSCIKYIRKGSIFGAYSALTGFQVFPDYYAAPMWVSYPTNVRSFVAYRTRTSIPCYDSTPIYVCDGDLPDIGLASGQVQPNGTISLYGDPEIGNGQLILQAQTHDHGPLIPWPGGYEVRGYCTQVGLTTFTLPVGSPAGTVVGQITCSNPLFTASLYPNWDLEQVGNDVRTKRAFNWPEDVQFDLTVTGPGLTYGASRYFTLKVR